jgi:transposase
VEAGVALYPVDPGRLKALRKPAGAKTDALDASALARLGRSELRELRRLVPDSDLVRELKVLTRDQDGLIQQQTRRVNQLTACRKEVYPVALGPFSQLQQRSTLAFLAAFPTQQQAAEAGTDAIATVLLRAKHPTARAPAARIAGQLQAPQLRADVATARAKARLTQALVAQLQLLVEQIAAYDAAVTALFAAHADRDLFASLPGAGKRLAPRLLAEWGEDRGRYAGAPSVPALAGTCPVLCQSGQYARARHRRACCKPLRQALHLFARESLHADAAARAYYLRRARGGQSPPGGGAGARQPLGAHPVRHVEPPRALRPCHLRRRPARAPAGCRVTCATPEAARPAPRGSRPVHPAGAGPRHRERRQE